MLVCVRVRVDTFWNERSQILRRAVRGIYFQRDYSLILFYFILLDFISFDPIS